MSLSGNEALEAVKQNGDALQYVNEWLFESLSIEIPSERVPEFVEVEGRKYQLVK